MVRVQQRVTAAAFAIAIAFAALLPGPSRAQIRTPVMRDQSGQAFSLSSIGTPVVLTFVSAHCVDACPLINAQFARMQQALQRSKIPIRLLTLSLDPKHDTPKDMQQIATTFSAQRRFWIVGSAPAPVLFGLMRRFGVTAERGNRDYDDIHTTFVYLLDRRGRFVKTILAGTNLPADVFAELQRDWNRLDG